MDKTASRPQGRKRIMALAVAGLAVVSMTAGATSLALFTDTETDDSTFTAGTIILDAAKIDALTLTNTNVMPGTVITGPVEVQNIGTSTLRYSLDSSTTSVAGPNGGVLNTALTVEVRVADGANDCSTFTGTLLSSAAETLGASNTLFGDPSPSGAVGDRTVLASASDWLCIRVALPSSTGDTFQGASATTTFTFNAEQV